MSKFNKDAYLKLSPKERQIYKNHLLESKSTLNEIMWAEDEERRILREKELGYSFYEYEFDDGFIHNIKNHLGLYTKPEKGFIVILSEEKLSELEEYGLEQLMINNSKSYDNYDLLIATYMSKYNKTFDTIQTSKVIVDKYNNEVTLSIPEVSKKISSGISLKDNLYAYCMYYEKILNRNSKSTSWKLIHKRKFKALQGFSVNS